MGYLKRYFSDVEQAENSNKVPKDNLTAHNNNKKEYIDIDNLAKITLSWLMGGIVSLMPTFIYVWFYPLSRAHSKISEEFFSNKDLFLVITTLTAGAMFEVFCSRRKGIVVYSSVAIGVILMVFSLLVFSLLLFQDNIGNTIHELPYIGGVLLGICFIYSIFGYIFVCWKGR